MNKKIRYTIYALLAIAFLGVVTWFIYSTEIAVLTPKGTIAEKQRNLIVTATWMMLIVVIPVFVLTFFISWKYRAGSGKGKYMPDWEERKKRLEDAVH